jgi:hypothetical protein
MNHVQARQGNISSNDTNYEFLQSEHPAAKLTSAWNPKLKGYSRGANKYQILRQLQSPAGQAHGGNSSGNVLKDPLESQLYSKQTPPYPATDNCHSWTIHLIT